MGKRNNQNFVQIPHARFISMLTYKAELAGITIILTEESYTSKASFLDYDPLPVHIPGDTMKYTFSGKRVKRGLYRAADGTLINADCNGSANIIRKVAPDAFWSEGGRGWEKGCPPGNPSSEVVVPLTKPEGEQWRKQVVKSMLTNTMTRYVFWNYYQGTSLCRKLRQCFVLFYSLSYNIQKAQAAIARLYLSGI